MKFENRGYLTQTPGISTLPQPDVSTVFSRSDLQRSALNSVWQFPLLAIAMAVLLICAVSPRLPLRRVAIPGAAFVASIAYSAYLVQKLVIHGVIEFCRAHAIDPKTAPALIGVELCVYAAATILFFTVERPFLQLRHRIASRSRASSLSRNRQG